MNHRDKKILGLILAILISFSTQLFTSCNSAPSSSLQVMMWGQMDGNIFKTSAKSVDSSMETYQDEKIPQTKNIVLGSEKAEEVRYERSQKDGQFDFAVYNSQNGELSCWYDSQTGDLIRLITDNNTILIPPDIATESEYQNWIENLLSLYGVEDVSGYRYSCKTTTIVSNENSAYKEKYMYFYSDFKGNEDLSSRTFTYTKYVEDYPTTDRIEITIFDTSGSVTIKFDEHKFDDPIEISFDEASIQTAVHSYISSSIDSKKYDCISMSIVNKTLTHFDTNVCMDVSVEIEVLNKENKSSFVVLVPLLIFME